MLDDFGIAEVLEERHDVSDGFMEGEDVLVRWFHEPPVHAVDHAHRFEG